jgi:hypothetical protein
VDGGDCTVTITDDMIARGSKWLSLRNGSTIDPRGGITDTPPPPTPVGNHFLYTSAQVTTFQSRMSGAGPFYTSGQGINGSQSNAPGDGVRALNHANAFIASPTVSRWTWPVPMVENGPWPGGSNSGITINDAIRPMRAAWCAMTLPSHANAASWRAQAKAWLLWNAAEPNHDFRNNTNWPVNYPGSQPSPIFAAAGWMMRIVKARDCLGRDAFTTAENTTFDNWIWGYANWAAKQYEAQVNNGKLPGMINGSITPVSSSQNGLRTQVAYNGGPYISALAMFTNRGQVCLQAAAMIANYLKYHAVTVSTAGTPSYGWFTVDQVLAYVKTNTLAWLAYSLHPSGYTFDYHRAQVGTSPPYMGHEYAANEIIAQLNWAKWAARRGDDSLWQLATTAGHNNTSGAPTAGGFPAKTLQYAQWQHTRYVNNGWGRVVTGSNGTTGPLARSNSYRDVLNAAVVSSRYPSDSLLMSGWTRIGNSMPGYPSSPQSQGSFSGWDGEMGTFIGLIEVGGV